MGSLKLLPVLILLGPAAALAQSPTFGLGRTPSADACFRACLVAY